MLLRQMPDALDALARGANPDEIPELPAGTGPNTVNWAKIDGIASLNDKTAGILGFGEIGAAFARMLTPFQTRTLAFRRRPLTPAQEAFYHVTWTPLDDLLRESDLVVGFVPGIPESKDLLGTREMGLMKPSAVLINCGRALSVNEEALVAALRSGQIAGAGLDVYSVEPLPRSSPLRGLDNVILTPHSAGGIGGWNDTFARIRSNLDAVRAGRSHEIAITMRPGDYQPG